MWENQADHIRAGIDGLRSSGTIGAFFAVVCLYVFLRRLDSTAIVALSTAVVQILYAFGPGLLGVLRDTTGGYGVPLALCIGLNLAATAVVLMQPRRPVAVSSGT